jgi:serine/threonine-protein kinase
MTGGPSPLQFKAGDIIAGKYRVERLLGAGGMGAVFLMTHLGLDEQVAIKFMRPELMNPTVNARFLREARAAARIKGEHVVRVSDISTLETGLPYIVMEYLEGVDLGAYLDRNGAFPLEIAVDYVLQACEALAEAHVSGIVHRDLKPSNLFLTKRPDGSDLIKVLDFGISKIEDRTEMMQAKLTGDTTQLGSPYYMSPEQMASSAEVDHRTDIWSLGIILCELVTRCSPFAAENVPALCFNIIQKPATPPSAFGAPPALDPIILKCLEKNPAGRFANVAELAAALAPFASARGRESSERVAAVIAQGPVPRASRLPGDDSLAVPLAPPSSTIGGFGTTNGASHRSHMIRMSVAIGTGVIGATLIALTVVLLLQRGRTAHPPEDIASASPAAPTQTAVPFSPIVVPPPPAPTEDPPASTSPDSPASSASSTPRPPAMATATHAPPPHRPVAPRPAGKKSSPSNAFGGRE